MCPTHVFFFSIIVTGSTHGDRSKSPHRGPRLDSILQLTGGRNIFFSMVQTAMVAVWFPKLEHQKSALEVSENRGTCQFWTGQCNCRWQTALIVLFRAVGQGVAWNWSQNIPKMFSCLFFFPSVSSSEPFQAPSAAPESSQRWQGQLLRPRLDAKRLGDLLQWWKPTCLAQESLAIVMGLMDMSTWVTGTIPKMKVKGITIAYPKIWSLWDLHSIHIPLLCHVSEDILLNSVL